MEAAPIDIILKNLKVFPQLLKVKAEEIMKEDEGFNRFFVEEQ
jgi:hypothetical protein